MAAETECAHSIIVEARICVDDFYQQLGYDGDCTPEEKADIEENCTPYIVTLVKRCEDCGDDYFGEDSLGDIWAENSAEALDQTLEQLSIDGERYSIDAIAHIFED